MECFDVIFQSLKNTSGWDFNPDQTQLLQEAVTLYSDDLLPGCGYVWCLMERERLQQEFVRLLHKGMEQAEVAGQFEIGLEYGNRCLRMDRACEATYRRMMRLFYAAGDRTRAIRQYQACLQILTEEFQVKPESLTKALFQHIQSGKPLPPPGSNSPLGRTGEFPIPAGMGLTSSANSISITHHPSVPKIDQ
ncbi:MAG: bacterial transcriptional activator domain-containing protein [Blastocatellia bacterium]|nr:bacterial transcriptional activator domain-containing protein [Blastocatellia bacterium]